MRRIAIAALLGLIGAAIFVWRTSANLERRDVMPALGELARAAVSVSGHYYRNGKFPDPQAYATRDPSVKSLVLEPGGRLVATLSLPWRAAGDGRHIVHEPIVINGELRGWKCTSDIERKNLVPNCQ